MCIQILHKIYFKDIILVKKIWLIDVESRDIYRTVENQLDDTKQEALRSKKIMKEKMLTYLYYFINNFIIFCLN